MLKSNIAWMKKNVPSDLKVWKGMIQDIDWSQVAAKTKLSLQRDKDRITAEFKEFAAMDTSAKIDWLMNGDRHLGYLYKKAYEDFNPAFHAAEEAAREEEK